MIIKYKLFENLGEPSLGWFVNCKGGADGWFTYIAPEFNEIIHNSIGKIIDYKENNDIFIVRYDNVPATIFGKSKAGTTTFKIYIDEMTYWSQNIEEIKNKMIEEQFDL